MFSERFLFKSEESFKAQNDLKWIMFQKYIYFIFGIATLHLKTCGIVYNIFMKFAETCMYTNCY